MEYPLKILKLGLTQSTEYGKIRIMKNDTHTIVTPVNGIRHLSDIEVFQCFNVEIDEHGHDLWGYRKIQDNRIGKRQVVKNDNLPHEPGSQERIEWLRGYYENQTDEISPFENTTTAS